MEGLAGALRGILGLPGYQETVGMIGLHHQGAFYELVPWKGEIDWEVGAFCSVQLFGPLPHMKQAKVYLRCWDVCHRLCVSS